MQRCRDQVGDGGKQYPEIEEAMVGERLVFVVVADPVLDIDILDLDVPVAPIVYYRLGVEEAMVGERWITLIA